MRYLKKILLFSLFAIFFSCIVNFGDSSITIEGKVTDKKGTSLQNVTVEFFHRNGSEKYETNSEGKYSIDVKTGGTGNLVFTKDGYSKTSKPSLIFKDGDNLIVNISLNTLNNEND